ncbi:MAG: M48 family metalloprotease [Rhodocyclaceae bacterium]|nr:M48 family metalloprotease [Rhodocyclaceae bacterium]
MDDGSGWPRHRWSNRLQTVLLIVTMLAISSTAGYLLLGDLGLWLTLGMAAAALVAEPAAGAEWTLRLVRARALSPAEAPYLWQSLADLAERAGLPAPPTPYYVPSATINAFAVGQRERSAIAVTHGLLRHLDRRELTGVLAHEIAHIAHDDLRVMNLAAHVGRITMVFSAAGQILLLLALPSLFGLGWWQVNWPALALLLFSPQIALLAQLGLSRVREFDADATAASLTGDPGGLALALARIEQTAPTWFARLLPGIHDRQPRWLRSHPETDRRIRRLQALAAALTRPSA